MKIAIRCTSICTVPSLQVLQHQSDISKIWCLKRRRHRTPIHLHHGLIIRTIFNRPTRKISSTFINQSRIDSSMNDCCRMERSIRRYNTDLRWNIRRRGWRGDCGCRGLFDYMYNLIGTVSKEYALTCDKNIGF